MTTQAECESAGRGACPEYPDKDPKHLDLRYTPTSAMIDAALAKQSVDLRDQPFVQKPWSVWDQRGSMACTAFAVCGAVHYLAMKHHGAVAFAPSRLLVYYWELVREGHAVAWEAADPSRNDWTTFTARVSDAVEAVREHGVIPTTMWRGADAPEPPGQEDDWTFHGPPTDAMHAKGGDHRALQHLWVLPDPSQLESSLAEGYPVTLLIALGKTFHAAGRSVEDGRRGIVRMPGPGDTWPGTYHALLIVGYDRTRAEFVFRNSEGTNWGDDGYGRIPYAWVADEKLSSSLWTIRSVE